MISFKSPLKIAADGTEAYYPKKWDAISSILAGFLALAIAECFRQETSVRVTAAIAVLILGCISFFPFRNLFLVLTGMAYLQLSREGLSFRYGRIASSFKWRDIRGFSSVQVRPPDGKLFMVGITFNDAASLTEGEKGDQKASLQVTQGRFGGILLPDEYDWKAAELAPYLNAMKERYGG